MNIDLIPLGDDPPARVNVIIEVPVGGEPVKYEYDKKSGAIFVNPIPPTPKPPTTTITPSPTPPPPGETAPVPVGGGGAFSFWLRGAGPADRGAVARG